MYIACNMPVMRSSRFLTFAGLVIVVFVPSSGGFCGRSALVAQDQIPDQYKVFTPALECHRGQLRRRSRVRPAGLRRHHGMLQTLDPHSSFMDPRSYAQMRERQEGRYYGLGHHHQRRRRRRHRRQRVRRVSGVSEGPSPRRRHREDRRRRHQGLDERAGGRPSARAQAARPSTSRFAARATTS